jgi:hypothetical protein
MHDWSMLEMTNSLTGMKNGTKLEMPFLHLQRPISGGGRLDVYRSTLYQSLCGVISATGQKHRQAMCHGIRCFTVSGTCEPETASLPRRFDGSRKSGRWIALHAIIRQLLKTCRLFWWWLDILLTKKPLIVSLRYTIVLADLEGGEFAAFNPAHDRSSIDTQFLCDLIYG